MRLPMDKVPVKALFALLSKVRVRSGSGPVSHELRAQVLRLLARTVGQLGSGAGAQEQLLVAHAARALADHTPGAALAATVRAALAPRDHLTCRAPATR